MTFQPAQGLQLVKGFPHADQSGAAARGVEDRIRQLAIDCLFAIYGETRGYRADLSDAERKRVQKKWAKAIRR